MAVTLAPTISLIVNGSYAATAGAGGNVSTAVDSYVKALTYAWTSGTGANQADRLLYTERTLTSGANEDLQFTVQFTDSLGSVFSPARLKLLCIYSVAANTVILSIGMGSATSVTSILTGTSPIIIVRPGGACILVAPDATGYAIGTGATDKLNILAGAATITYGIIAMGASV